VCAQVISNLLVRRNEEGYIDATGEAEELDFAIPRGLAIAIFGIESNIGTGDLDAALGEMDAFVDLDGPALVVGSLASAALFDARKILDSVIFLHQFQQDIVTTGASILSDRQMMWYPEPILTARNLGLAGLALGSAGEWNVGIWYKWVRISDAEFVGLVIDQRA